MVEYSSEYIFFVTEKGILFKNSMTPFNNKISCSVMMARYFPRKENHEKQTNPISANSIIVDNGTAIKFVKRNKFGNWWK